MNYPLKGFTPLIIESYRHIKYKDVTYKRRLRISRYNALLIDEKLGTYIGRQNTKFVVLDLDDIKKVCDLLRIKYKPVNTYFHIDLNMCSFEKIPTLI